MKHGSRIPLSYIFPFSLRIFMQQTNKAGRVRIKIPSSFEAEKFFTNVKIDPGEIRSRALRLC